MQQYMKKNIIYFMVVTCLFMLCPSCVYASEHGGGGGTDHNSDFITDSGTINVQDDGVVMYYIEYILANIGAIISDHDLLKAMANDQTIKEYISKGKIDANGKDVTFPKETVIYVKQYLEDYAKQNEPFYMVETVPLDYIPLTQFANHKNVYDTLVNLLNESPSGIIAFGSYDGTMCYTDLGHWFTQLSPVRAGDSSVRFYFNENWNQITFRVWMDSMNAEAEPIKSRDEFANYPGNRYLQSASYTCTICNIFSHMKPNGDIPYTGAVGASDDVLPLITKDRRRIRVFNTYGDFQNYTLGKRSVYYTSNYYNYVPDDLTVSIDDLQKSVDDLQKVIDDLLDQITKDTDESEIEELLQQILDELKNQQGTGGGGGSGGGGDVTVNVDMTQTNSWLAQIYAKVSQIYDKMNSTVEAAGDAALAKIQESLDEIIEQLKKIKHWAAVDTVIDGVDAVADWADLIYSVLKDGAGSAVSTVSTLAEDATDLMSQKFPFSIPWDILFFVSVLAAEPETPHFEIPFNFEYPALDLAVDYQMELDFTPLQWLSDLSRLLLSMTYAVGLMKKTAEIVMTSKE